MSNIIENVFPHIVRQAIQKSKYGPVVKLVVQCRMVLLGCGLSGGGATRPLLRDEVAEEFHGDPIVGARPKVWIRGQK